MSNKRNNWVPEIMYEESAEGAASNFPFIQVPKDETMPSLLYISESQETGEVEPGPEGEELPVFEWDMHQYADMGVLKSTLRPELYDEVRGSLGLQPMAAAVEAGQKITQNVKSNLE